MPVTDITPTELAAWLEAEDAVLIDVRETDEYAAGRIAGSHNAPLSTGPYDMADLPISEGKKVVFQCKLGGRSRRAAEQVTTLAPDQTFYNLAGGIEAWQSAGLPVINC